MPRLAKRLATYAYNSNTIAATLLAAVVLAGSTAPSSAFIEASPRTTWMHHHHHHAPSGANVIGRGVGGLHGRLAADADREQFAAQVDDAQTSCADRYRSYDPTTGTFLGYDGHEHPCP